MADYLSQPNPQPTSPQYNEPAPTTSPQLPQTSPLDNPWGSPPQPPPIEGSLPSQIPSAPENKPMPNPEATPAESTPTDLSHLISNNHTPDTSPASNTSETLVLPQANPEVPTLPAETHNGIPKWLIGVGVGLLVIVAGASAYFILGIGQPPKNPTSLPAETSDTKEVKPPAPVATSSPKISPTPSPSGSANFGAIEGTGSASTKQATSAAELLKQKKKK